MTTMPNPITPWDPSPRSGVQATVSATTPSPGLRSRFFGRNGAYTNPTASIMGRRPISVGFALVQVDPAPIPRAMLTNSAALRLQRRGELLDKRINVHVRPNGLPPQPPVIYELEGTVPVTAELEGSSPETFVSELEGSTPETTFKASEGRVYASSAVRTVTVTQPKSKHAKKFSLNAFRPDRTKYAVECSNAAGEVAAMEEEEAEKQVFVDQLNYCRKTEGQPFLIYDTELSAHAQHHADNYDTAHPLAFVHPDTLAQAVPSLPQRPETVVTIFSPLTPDLLAVRVTSERGLGAMACAERWYSGKLKHHHIPVTNLERHAMDCSCRLRIVYETVFSAHYGRIGVGKGVEGAGRGVWVVELSG